MRNIHLVIPDLFLPQPLAAEVCAGLALPGLEKLLARAQAAPLSTESLETWLCEAFGVADQAIAAVTLQADGGEPGTAYYLRADPVHLRLQRDQLILQAGIPLTADEAVQLCASLSAHFADDGLHFFAPHPQRWYLQLDDVPNLSTRPLAQVAGRDIRAHLPQGGDALRWHRLFNEIQMLLFDHPLNLAREARGELPINSVWLWGGGHAIGELARPYLKVFGDSDLVAAFARVANIPYDFYSGDAMQYVAGGGGDVLITREGLCHALQQGDLHAWRDGLQQIEQCCVQPLLDALGAGRTEKITLDVPQAGGARRFVLTRGAAWKLWRRSKPLSRYQA